MHVLDTKTDQELIQSLLAELAKSTNELRCARQDLDKMSSRLGFTIALCNELIKRQQGD
jgi:hypothetical protein